MRALAGAVVPGGAGEAAAEAILRHRAAALADGRLPFRTVKDLARVAGLAVGAAAALSPHVTVWSLEDGIAPGAVDPALRPLLAEEAGRPGAVRGLGWRRYAVELDVTTGRGATAGFAASVVLEPGGAAPWRLLEACLADSVRFCNRRHDPGPKTLDRLVSSGHLPVRRQAPWGMSVQASYGAVMGLNSVNAALMEEDSASAFKNIRAELLEEYRHDHNYPWIIGYSGGKDSTLVAHLVFEMLIGLPPSERKRVVHIVANDTLVESPLVVQHIIDSVQEIQNAAQAFGLPVLTKITRPAPDQSFWVNLIGRGYPSPNRSFRWCTDRMKILPTSRYIKSQVDDAGQVILLLGVRRSESATRAASVGRYDTGERLNKHNDLIGCMVFRPIVELRTDDVWEFLALNEPPWGGSHLKLIDLYREASGGECPVVTSKDDAPSCGTSSSRFGCWTCTVVEKDRSLEGFVEYGYTEFGPLLDFRDWLASIRNDPDRRQARRRDGRITITDGGTFIPGPFTFQTRAEILAKLRALEAETGQVLISEEEISLIYDIWAKEHASYATARTLSVREVRKEK